MARVSIGTQCITRHFQKLFWHHVEYIPLKCHDMLGSMHCVLVGYASILNFLWGGDVKVRQRTYVIICAKKKAAKYFCRGSGHVMCQMATPVLHLCPLLCSSSSSALSISSSSISSCSSSSISHFIDVMCVGLRGSRVRLHLHLERRRK